MAMSSRFNIVKRGSTRRGASRTLVHSANASLNFVPAPPLDGGKASGLVMKTCVSQDPSRTARLLLPSGSIMAAVGMSTSHRRV